MSELLHGNVTSAILRSFYSVYNDLGYGFLEKVYENAMFGKLRDDGLTVRQQFPVRVVYDGRTIGDFFADLMIDEAVIVEIRSVEYVSRLHEAQLVNYLKATGIEVGMLLNFGPQADFRRRVLTKKT